MFEFTVDRSMWIRGARSQPSKLLRESDNKMCCMGFCALAQGCSKESILNRTTLQTVNGPLLKFNASHIEDIYIQYGENVYYINDNPLISDKLREKQLTELLLTQDVKVTFK